MPATKKIESDLLRLPAKTRARIASRLIDSLDEQSAAEVEKEWLVEAQRRESALRTKRTKGIQAGTVFMRVKSALS